MSISLFQKIRSYLYPVLIRTDSSIFNPVLELYHYRNRWQLATSDALYSDGVKYRPLLAAFKALKLSLPNIRSVLVLGTGLASAVQILNKQGYHPAFTLVELDPKILSWALELLPGAAKGKINPICTDAALFLEQDKQQYDLIIVDIFNSRTVPGFVTEPAFIQQLYQHLASGGNLVLNYMVAQPGDEQKAKAALEAAFGKVDVLSFYLNRVFIAKA